MSKSKKKWYAYEQYWSDRAGETKERPVGKKDIKDVEDYSLSRDNPTTRKQKKELYEKGFGGIGHKTGGDYLDTVEWGKEGGRPKKWTNDAERKKTHRAQKKLNAGLQLTTTEKSLLGLIQHRPGAYKYHTSRPASAAERKRKERAKNKLSLGKPLKEEEKKLLGMIL